MKPRAGHSGCRDRARGLRGTPGETVRSLSRPHRCEQAAPVGDPRRRSTGSARRDRAETGEPYLEPETMWVSVVTTGGTSGLPTTGGYVCVVVTVSEVTPLTVCCSFFTDVIMFASG